MLSRLLCRSRPMGHLPSMSWPSAWKTARFTFSLSVTGGWFGRGSGLSGWAAFHSALFSASVFGGGGGLALSHCSDVCATFFARFASFGGCSAVSAFVAGQVTGFVLFVFAAVFKMYPRRTFRSSEGARPRPFKVHTRPHPSVTSDRVRWSQQSRADEIIRQCPQRTCPQRVVKPLAWLLSCPARISRLRLLRDVCPVG